MTVRREHPRRRRLLGRRPPAVHRPTPPAPETPAEVLERAPAMDPLTGQPLPTVPPSPEQALAEQSALDWPVGDVSRETWAELEAALEGPEAAAVEELLPLGRYVAGGQVPPPLRKDQVARLEALTAQWERQVRLEAPEDATMLYGASRSLPPVPPAPSSVSPVAGPARVSAWSSRHDPRSLEYALRDRLRTPVPLQDLLLDRGPILDQGTTPPLSARDAAACTGMAAVAAANVLYLGPNRGDSRAGWGLLDEAAALEVYHRAQDLDHVHGHDAPGTSVLAVMQAGQEAGWWDAYLWALAGTRDIAQALLQFHAPVVLGIPWPAGMEDPDPAGIVRPTGAAGMGHALAVVGIRRSLRGAAGPWFVLQQSRGPAEGDGGLVYLHHQDLGRLLRGVGEAAVPLPRWGLS